MSSVTIAVLIENHSSRDDLIAEHGLSLWIETDGFRVLFDTGQSGALLSNARQLGIPLSSADAVVLSHGHYDHTGGLDAVTPLLRAGVRVFAHPTVIRKRYAVCPPSPPREIGFRGDPEAMKRLKTGREPVKIAPGILLTGEIPRTNGFEDTGGPFFLDPEGKVPDPILDDQALIIESDAGVILVVGCAHAGVVNTLKHAQQLSDSRSVHAVLGGMHLSNASGERLARTVGAFRELGLRLIAPCHCTGEKAVDLLRREFPTEFLSYHTGSAITFGAATTKYLPMK